MSESTRDLGRIKNHFGLLQDSLTAKLDPERLREFMLPEMTGAELARVLEIGRASLYRSSLKLDTAVVKARIVPLVIAADLAFDIFKSDGKQAKDWMTAPNAYFFGQSPAEVCLSGEGKEVIILLRERMGQSSYGVGGTAIE